MKKRFLIGCRFYHELYLQGRHGIIVKLFVRACERNCKWHSMSEQMKICSICGAYVIAMNAIILEYLALYLRAHPRGHWRRNACIAPPIQASDCMPCRGNFCVLQDTQTLEYILLEIPTLHGCFFQLRALSKRASASFLYKSSLYFLDSSFR